MAANATREALAAQGFKDFVVTEDPKGDWAIAKSGAPIFATVLGFRETADGDWLVRNAHGVFERASAEATQVFGGASMERAVIGANERAFCRQCRPVERVRGTPGAK